MKGIFYIMLDNKIIVPNIYKEFELEHGEFLNDGGIMFFKVNQIREAYIYMEFEKYAPEYIPIGNDSGNLVFVMKQEKFSKEVIILPDSFTGIDSAYEIIDDFKKWSERNFPIADNTIDHRYVNILLLTYPEGGVKSLFEIRKSLELDYSMKELLEKSRNLPSILKENIIEECAIKLINSSEFSDILSLG